MRRRRKAAWAPSEESLVHLLVTIAEAAPSTLRLQELAGEGIAEMARYNAWVLTRKGQASDRELVAMEFLEGRCTDDARAAWEHYTRVLSGEARAQAEAALEAAASRLRTARVTNTIDTADLDIPEELLD
jgi:hypothetical protein